MTSELCPLCGVFWRGPEHRCQPNITTTTTGMLGTMTDPYRNAKPSTPAPVAPDEADSDYGVLTKDDAAIINHALTADAEDLDFSEHYASDEVDVEALGEAWWETPGDVVYPHSDRPAKVDWWWTEEGRAQHDRKLRESITAEVEARVSAAKVAERERIAVALMGQCHCGGDYCDWTIAARIARDGGDQ